MLSAQLYNLKENLQEKKNQSLFEDLQISNIETEVELIQAEVNEITEKVSTYI